MDLPLILFWASENLEVIGSVGLALLLLYYLWPLSSDAALLSRFGLNAHEWKVLGHDLGNSNRPYCVRALGLIGRPDFVAVHKRRRVIKVFDYKHRTHTGKTRPYELYQVILYCMAIEQMNPGFKVCGAIRYKNKILDITVRHSDRAMLLSRRDQFKAKYL